MSLENDIDVIDFYRPIGNAHSVYVSSLLVDFDSIPQLENELTTKFSQYGLVYNVRVVIADDKLTINDTLGNAENTENRRETNLVSCYAFVDFYSAKAALKAIQGLTCRILTAGKPARLKLSRMTKAQSVQRLLYLADCYKLANHYLGFNGWSIEIQEHSAQYDKATLTIKSSCIVQLSIFQYGDTLTAMGSATTQQQLDVKSASPSNMGMVLCAARKLSHRLASEHAFSKVVLCVLPTGKVYADVANTELECASATTLVTDLSEQPESESDDDENWCAMDEQNRQMLAELATDNDHL